MLARARHEHHSDIEMIKSRAFTVFVCRHEISCTGRKIENEWQSANNKHLSENPNDDRWRRRCIFTIERVTSFHRLWMYVQFSVAVTALHAWHLQWKICQACIHTTLYVYSCLSSRNVAVTPHTTHSTQSKVVSELCLCPKTRCYNILNVVSHSVSGFVLSIRIFRCALLFIFAFKFIYALSIEKDCNLVIWADHTYILCISFWLVALKGERELGKCTNVENGWVIKINFSWRIRQLALLNACTKLQ